MRNYLLLLSLLLLSSYSYAQWTDPTRPPGFESASSQELSLNAILGLQNHPTAIINGQLLRPGDTITNYRLLTIGTESVRLQGPDGVFTLPLIDKPIKTRTTYRTTTE